MEKGADDMLGRERKKSGDVSGRERTKWKEKERERRRGRVRVAGPKEGQLDDFNSFVSKIIREREKEKEGDTKDARDSDQPNEQLGQLPVQLDHYGPLPPNAPPHYAPLPATHYVTPSRSPPRLPSCFSSRLSSFSPPLYSESEGDADAGTPVDSERERERERSRYTIDWSQLRAPRRRDRDRHGGRVTPPTTPSSSHPLSFLPIIGTGAFGTVHRASYRHSLVAVKVVSVVPETGTPAPGTGFGTDQDAVLGTEFEREASVLLSLPPHPNVITFLGITPPPLSLVFEYARKGALSTLLAARSSQPLPPGQAVSLLAGTAAGMSHLAAERLVHKDLAARNVLVDGQGVAKVSDFGLSLFLEGTERARYVSAVVAAKWAAPEALLNHRWSESSDVWSFGVLVLEVLLVGTEPVADVSVPTLLTSLRGNQDRWRSMLLHQLPPPPECPKALGQLVSKCLQVDPVARPTFAGIAMELEAMGEALTRGRSAASPTQSSQRQQAPSPPGSLSLSRPLTPFEYLSSSPPLQNATDGYAEFPRVPRERRAAQPRGRMSGHRRSLSAPGAARKGI